MKKLRASAMITGMVAVLSSMPALAQGEKCLRVVGTDWASEQQSVDPLINNHVADLMRLTTIYEKLVELDNALPLEVMNLCIDIFLVAPMPKSGEIFGFREIMLATGDAEAFDCLETTFLMNEFFSLFISSMSRFVSAARPLLLHLPILFAVFVGFKCLKVGEQKVISKKNDKSH